MMNDELKEKSADLKVRTKQFAIRVVRMFSALPATTVAQTIGKQVLRSGTSVGAQYREGCRARSDAEIVSKWESALQELEETAYWFELLVECEVLGAERMVGLIQECDEVMAMLTASVKTVKARKNG